MARDFVLSIEAAFPRHPKTRKFSRLMGTPLAPAYLVNLWAWAVEAAPSGDISSYDVSDIEDGAGYSLCNGKCYQALVDAGFIDDDGAGARVLHNWMESGRTGQAIQKMETERDRWRRAKGIPTSSARNHAGVIAEATRESAGVHAPSRFTVHGSESSPPAPAIPVITEEPVPAQRPSPAVGLPPPRAPYRPFPVGAATPSFEAVFDAYPRKDAKLKAAAVFQELAETYDGGEKALSAAILASFAAGMLKRPPYAGPNGFRPLLETVLAERRWEDPQSAPDDAEPAKVRATGPPRHASNQSERIRENFEKGRQWAAGKIGSGIT